MIADEAQHTRCDRVRVLQRKLYRAAKGAPLGIVAAEMDTLVARALAARRRG